MKRYRHFVMAPRYLATGFFVRGTGHFIITQKEVIKQAHYGEIFWCARGSGIVFYQEKKYPLSPGSVFYFPPGSCHDFTPSENGCDYYWLSVEGENAGVLFDSLGLIPGISESGTCPEALFEQLSVCLRNSIRESQLKALSIAFEILTLAVSPSGEKTSAMEPIKEYIDQHFCDPETDINGIARHFSMHRVQLSRKFRSRYGVAPGEYLTSLRIQKGIALLTSTELAVKEIAEQCGFSSADYFTKSIRKAIGIPPGAVRNGHK